MGDFPTFTNLEQLDASFNQHSIGLPFNTETCTIQTLFEGVNVDPTLINRVTDPNTPDREKSALINHWMTEYFKVAAARKAPYWMLGNHFRRTCITEIMKPDYDEITGWVRDDNTMAECPIAKVTAYSNLSLQFRENIQTVLILSEFNSGEGEVPEELHVNAETLVGLNRILTAIIEKRRAALGNRPANAGTGCQHYPYLVDFIASGNNQPLIDSKKRTKGVGGIIGVQGNANLEELEELDATGVVKHGRLLLTTALAEYSRLNGNLPAGIRNRREPEMVRALLELDAMNAEGKVDNSVYRQQIGNLVIIFNFYLHCRAAGIINGANPPVNVFKRLNLTLHAIGTKIQGRAKTNMMLTRAGAPISNLVNLLNVTGSKHQPPYCLNSRRVYDLVSVFGIIK
ncbi:hypothetical protein JTE90_005938, partial [Oedothorax gibbosus]